MSAVEASSAALPLDTWSHFVGVFDFAGDRVAMYINGELLHEETVRFNTAASDDTPSDFGSIGAEDDGSDEFFPGYIADVQVIAAARNADRIRASYLNEGGYDFVVFGETQSLR